MPAILPPDDPTLLHLRDLLGSDFASQLAVLVNRVGVTQVAVRVEAHVCSTGGDHAGSVVVEPLPATQGNPTPVSSPGAQVRRDFLQHLPSELELRLHLQLSHRIHHLPSPVEPTSALLPTQSQNESSTSETAILGGYHPSGAPKRRKVVGALRPCTSRERQISTAVERESCDDEGSARASLEQEQPLKAPSIRQVHTTTRFPQRTARKDQSVPIMTSTSTEKLVCGIWRQIHSEIRWDMTATVSKPRLL
jgi:hypothetical protein